MGKRKRSGPKHTVRSHTRRLKSGKRVRVKRHLRTNPRR